MNAKEYLSQALWLDQRINSKLEQLETLRALAMKVSANLTEEKVSGSNNINSLSYISIGEQKIYISTDDYA